MGPAAVSCRRVQVSPRGLRHPRPLRLGAVADASAPLPAGSGERVIVIGAGVGGLATAGRLARAGLDVTVLEKNAEVCPACLPCSC
jgi:phytoene desaturase (3,4-didehydrolycopene-forming)